jgi:hypothetical protein
MLLIIIAFASPQADTGAPTEMTEDSGAFKTIPVVFAPGSGICDDPGGDRCNEVSPAKETPVRRAGGHGPDNF